MTGQFRGLIWETELTGNAGTLKRPAAYALLVFPMVVLGLNWPILSISLDSITPIWMAAIRVGIAAVALGVVGVVTGNVAVPRDRDLVMVVLVGVTRLAGLMVLVFFAVKLVTAGRASVLVWTSSLWTVPIAAVFLRERMVRTKWIGLAVGLSGVVILSEFWNNDWRQPGVLLGTGLLLSGAIVSAGSAVYLRAHRWSIEPFQAVPWQMGIATVPLVIGALIVDGPPQIDWTPQLVWMMAYQGVLASGLAFWAQVVVLQNLSAVSTNLTMTGVPVIGVVSSAVVLDERVSVALAIGMVLVISGVVINLLSDTAVRSAH